MVGILAPLLIDIQSHCHLLTLKVLRVFGPDTGLLLPDNSRYLRPYYAQWPNKQNKVKRFHFDKNSDVNKTMK